MLDLWGREHALRLKAWSNGDGRMYVLEDVASLLSCYDLAVSAAGLSSCCDSCFLFFPRVRRQVITKRHRHMLDISLRDSLQAGDRLMFGKLPSGSMVACGMQSAAPGSMAVPKRLPKPAPKQRDPAKRSAVQAPAPASARQRQQLQQEHSKKKRAAAPAVAVRAQLQPVAQQVQQVAPAEKVGAVQQ